MSNIPYPDYDTSCESEDDPFEGMTPEGVAALLKAENDAEIAALAASEKPDTPLRGVMSEVRKEGRTFQKIRFLRNETHLFHNPTDNGDDSSTDALAHVDVLANRHDLSLQPV